jgi:hypothetical protein
MITPSVDNTVLSGLTSSVCRPTRSDPLVRELRSMDSIYAAEYGQFQGGVYSFRKEEIHQQLCPEHPD